MATKKSKLVEIKTKPTADSVTDFISKIADEGKRKDCFTLAELMKKATGENPVLWGSAIIGYGNKRYKSPATGREVDWFHIGFAPRKANFSLYVGAGNPDQAAALKKLGKYKTGGGCLYINKLEDVDLKVLQQIIVIAAKRGVI